MGQFSRSLLGQFYLLVDSNIVGYADGNGAIVAAREFTPYGRVIAATSSSPDYPIGYSGQYTDAETGLVYYGLRYYSPRLGRFVNRDPIEEAGGNNLYAFVGNSPTNGWDVRGLALWCHPAGYTTNCHMRPDGVFDCTATDTPVGWICEDIGGGSGGSGGSGGNGGGADGNTGGNTTGGNTGGDRDSNKKSPCEEARAALTAAQNSRGAYTGVGAPGWQRAQTWSNDGTGFGAVVFTNSDTGQAMLAFRGTDGFSGLDWVANIGQWAGQDTPQYEQAVSIARDFSRTYGGSNASITGHSLGGGLASLGGLVTGLNTYTFNAVGLSPSTMSRNNVSTSMGGNIQAYYVFGEILSLGQDLSGRYQAVGNRIALAPTLNATNILAGLATPFFPLTASAEIHRINQVISSLEQRVASACGGK